MELNFPSGITLKDTTKINKILNRGGVDVGDTGEVENNGAEDGLGEFSLATNSLLLVSSLFTLPAVRSRVCESQSESAMPFRELRRAAHHSMGGHRVR